MSNIHDSKTQGKTIRIECLECKTITKHEIMRALDWADFIGVGEIRVWGTHQIVRCNGCDTLSFRAVLLSEEEYGLDEAGDICYFETEKLYPERYDRSLLNELYLRDDIYDIPTIIQSIYRETVSSVQHNLPTLAGIGIRAVIEAICREKKAKKRNLEGKIDELVDMSLLTPEGAKILHGIRLLGNDAAHEMKAPNKKQILAALKVIDHLLLGVYVLPKEADVLPKPTSKPEKKAVAKKSAKRPSGSKP